jgi:hypothetical protein
MKSHLIVSIILFCAMVGTAYAKPTNEIMMEGLHSPHVSITGAPKPIYRAPKHRVSTGTTAKRHNVGGRPGKWCGWWMRTQFGGGPEYNLARNWSRRGSPASGPQVGAVVVWPHHVGYITGRAANGKWIVKSGNDGGRVRERARSVSGAIAFRVV